MAGTRHRHLQLLTAEVTAAVEGLARAQAATRDQDSEAAPIESAAAAALVAGICQEIGALAWEALGKVRAANDKLIARARTGRRAVATLLITAVVLGVIVVDSIALKDVLADTFELGANSRSAWLAAGAIAVIFNVAGWALLGAIFTGIGHRNDTEGDGSIGKGVARATAVVAGLAVLGALAGFSWLRTAYAAEGATSLTGEPVDLATPTAVAIFSLMCLNVAVAAAFKTTTAVKDSATRVVLTNGFMRNRIADIQAAIAPIDALRSYLNLEARARELTAALDGVYRATYLAALDPTARDYQNRYEVEHRQPAAPAPQPSPWVARFEEALATLEHEIRTLALPLSEATPNDAGTQPIHLTSVRQAA